MIEDSRNKELLAKMGHELRTPLNHIIGYAEIMQNQSKGPLNVQQQNYLSNILHSSEYLLALINDIVDLAKLDCGEIELDLEETAVLPLLRNCVANVRELARFHSLRFNAEFGPAIPARARVDRAKVKKVFSLLIEGAFRLATPNTIVDLKADYAEGINDPPNVGVTISIVKCLLDGDSLEAIFQPFERLSAGGRSTNDLTGLEFLMAENLVHVHGGDIWTESAEDSGAVIGFTLPLID